MNIAKPLLRATAAAALAFKGIPAWAVNDSPGGPAVLQLNLPVGVTRISSEIYDLHTIMMVICTVIFVLVFGVMFYSVLKHRKSLGHKAATWHENTAVEIIWTVIPFIIVILMALPATKTVVAMKDTTNADLTIKATGYQWKWGYDYLKGEGEGISFLSALSTPRAMVGAPGRGIKAAPAGDNYLLEVDNEVYVPVNKKVRIITTANDVIHAWAVPQLGVKQDAIPGFVRDTWFKAEKIGVYRGQCQELCGKEHAFMPIVVNVVSDADYTKWVTEKKQAALALADDPNKTWTQAELIARGEKAYQNCVACHQATGKGIPGAFPALEASQVVLGPKDDVIKVVLNGRNNGKMPPWKHLSDVEVAGVLNYVRNSWSNKAGENTIQPAEVKAARS